MGMCHEMIICLQVGNGMV